MFVHHTAEVAESATVGEGTKIWHQAQIRPDARIGANCILGKAVYIDEHVEIGNNVKIQNRASIYRDCIIEDGVFIGPHVCFTNDIFPRAINPDGTLKRADDWAVGHSWVKYGASIGAGTIILPSRTIGRFALVGAGSVVTRDVPDHGLVVGNPARLIGYVCVCGSRLEINDGTGRCGACDRHYNIGESVSALEVDRRDELVTV